jgi:hypothetical protein
VRNVDVIRIFEWFAVIQCFQSGDISSVTFDKVSKFVEQGTTSSRVLDRTRLRTLLSRQRNSCVLTIRRHSEPSRNASLAAFTARSTSFYGEKSTVHYMTKAPLMKVYFRSICHFGDHITRGGIDHFESASTCGINKLVVNEELNGRSASTCVVFVEQRTFWYFTSGLRSTTSFFCADADAARVVKVRA